MVKLFPGINFINVFTRSFYACRSQNCKKLLELSLFALLGSASIKAVHKMLVKLTPDEKWKEGIVTAEIISGMDMNVVPSPYVVDIIKESF